MKTVAFLLAAMALVGVALGQQERCQSVPQWTADVTSFDPNERVFHNHTSEYFFRGRFAYDETLPAIRRIMDEEFGQQQPEFLDVLERWDTRTAYVTDLRTHECKTYHIPEEIPFPKIEVPDDARGAGYVTIGAPGDATTLSVWMRHDEIFEGTEFWRFTRPFPGTNDCLPVRHDGFFNATGFHYLEIENPEIGVDPNDFTPPTHCS